MQTVLDYLRSDETKELNHHYLYQYPEKNEEDNKCSRHGMRMILESRKRLRRAHEECAKLESVI